MSVTDLVNWAASNGALISSGIEFKTLSHANVGAIYTKKADDEALENNQIRLPLDLIITLEDAISTFGKGISDKTSNVNSLLKLYIARERGSEIVSTSKLKNYLQLLPSLKDVNSPYTWSPKDLECIKGTNLGSSLKSNLASQVEEWWQIINLIPESITKPKDHFINMKFYYEFKFHKDTDLHDLFTKDDTDNWTSFPNYLWASLMLKSRGFPAYLINEFSDRDIKVDEVMLLPIIDLLNHDPKADVEWSVNTSKGGNYFDFKSNSLEVGKEVFNNYGRKGNEELLLAYGFCIENNEADSVALKIKVPMDLLPELEEVGIKLPKLEDYTTSVVRNEDPQNKSDYNEYKDGLLFFINHEYIPEDLIKLFQHLVKTSWESEFTLRNRLAGLNQLRQALDTKVNLIATASPPQEASPNFSTIKNYVQSQKKILSSGIKNLKRLEKSILTDPENKSSLITLKNVIKKDKKFADALLVSLGITSYDQLIENSFQDQAWLLYLIRCHNKDVYKDEEDNFLPQWIYNAFERVVKEHAIEPQEILQYEQLYEGLIIPLTQTAPDVFNRGNWTVEELIYSARVLDTISFVRGKEQECILVQA